MARIRTIKPEFWSHPVMGRKDDCCKMIAVALLNFSDDEGYFTADPILVRNFARPFDEDSTSVRRGLEQLSKIGWIEVVDHPSHGPIGRVVNFQEHQRIDRPSPSKIKVYFDSSNTRRVLDEGSTLEQGTGNREQGKDLPPTGVQGDIKKSRKPSWQNAHPSEVIQATQEIKAIWPTPGADQFQPDMKTLVPGVSTSELASRLADIAATGADLSVCVQIARRAVTEWQNGKWIKAPQHFFGKAKDAPYKAYYQAFVTNSAVKLGRVS